MENLIPKIKELIVSCRLFFTNDYWDEKVHQRIMTLLDELDGGVIDTPFTFSNGEFTCTNTEPKPLSQQTPQEKKK